MEEQRTTTVRESDSVNGGEVRQETVATSRTVSGTTLAIRIIWFVAGFIITLLGLRVILQLLGANDAAGFVTFIYAISDPFAAPFYYMFPEPTRGVSTLDISSIFAMIVYALIAWGITKLLTLNRPRTV